MIAGSLTLAVVSRDPDDVRERTRRILDGREYRDEDSLSQRIRDWFQDPIAGLQELWRKITSYFGGAEGPFAAGIAWAFTIVIAALIIFFVVRLARSTSANQVSDLHPGTLQRLTETDLLKEADEFEARGEWRRAIRARHAALVVTLDRRGIVRLKPGVTAREYAWEVSRNAPSAGASFGAATTLFEWVWYGTGTPTQDDVETFRGHAEAVAEKVAS